MIWFVHALTIASIISPTIIFKNEGGYNARVVENNERGIIYLLSTRNDEQYKSRIKSNKYCNWFNKEWNEKSKKWKNIRETIKLKLQENVEEDNNIHVFFQKNY